MFVVKLYGFCLYCMSMPILHRESVDSLIHLRLLFKYYSKVKLGTEIRFWYLLLKKVSLEV